MAYVPLHVHSVSSSFEGMMTFRELVERASFLGFRAMALTDHWSTYGHFEFFELARRADIKPILGAEIQHASLMGSQGFYHLTVLAENERGYRNLCSLVSRHSMREKEPHVTVDELAAHRDGLMVLSGCLRGEASQAILHGNLGRARDIVIKLTGIFGDRNVFLEVMNHNKPTETLVAEQLYVLSTKVNVPVVVTNNDRYVHQEDGEYYRIARLLNRKKPESEDEVSMREYYLKREKDLIPFFNLAADAFDRSGEIAERCTVDLSRSGRISFSAAPNPHDSLVDMCRRRFLLTFHTRPADERAFLTRAMERELESAREERLSDFLIFLRELFTVAMERGIWLELMGSDLLESIVAHLLEIISLNPIDHDLVFESFSPSKRGSLPPVELIISEEKKEHFIAIVRELLPECAPSFMVTQEEMSIGTIAKEAAEALETSQELRDEISRILSFERRHRSLAALLESSQAAQQLYTSEPLAKHILHAAFALQGKLCRLTLDSSKLVIMPREVEGLYSFTEGPGGERFAQLGAAAVEGAGGWVAGIQHSHFLSALEKAIDTAQKECEPARPLGLFKGSERKRWTPESLDDPLAFALIASGETVGVYLLESQGIRDHLMRIKPASFGELVNVISLYRPGPMEGRLWEKYLENAEKKGKVYLPHHSLAPILAGTRGLLLYREQVREILEEAAGLRGKDAVAIEGALWNRDSGELMAARLTFMRGAMDVGLNEEDAQRIFDFLLHNITFTHSKALSCAQASVSYRTAYLKAHCFERYFVALLNSNLDVKERQTRYLEYLKSKGVSVVPVGINASSEGYSFENGVIRAPVNAVVSIDRAEWEAIQTERSLGGDFASLSDFLERMNGRVAANMIIELIDVGVFDEAGVARGTLKAMCRSFDGEKLKTEYPPSHPRRKPGSKKQKESERQISLFGFEADEDPPRKHR